MRRVIPLVLIIVVIASFLIGMIFLKSPASGSTTTVIEPHVLTQLCRGHAKCWEGTVTRIADGDSLEVDSVRIRLALIDSPELDQPGGPESRGFVEGLCPVGSKAIVDQDDMQLTDTYGRVIAVVWCSGKNVNEGLLYAGLAQIYLKHCPESEFRDEEWARRYGCG